jgi:hypothetical protein
VCRRSWQADLDFNTIDRMNASRMTKIAGASLLGFVAVSLAADKISLNPALSQLAGLLGGLVGSLVSHGRERSKNGESLRAQVRGETTEHAYPPRLEDEGQSGG